LLLVAFIPLLLVEDDLTRFGEVKNARKVYLYAVLAIFIWNVITTWWIKNASLVGLVAAVVVSTLYMSLAVYLYSYIKSRFGRLKGYVSFIILWLALEFAYNHGEISWPWLTLGNGFMFSLRFIQWYDVTGVLGGSLWILLSNVLLYEIWRRLMKGETLKKLRTSVIIASSVVVLPVMVSVILYYTYHEVENPHEIVVVQPNIDPYMKFNDIPSFEQTRIQVNLAASSLTDSTDYVVCPETSITNNIWIGFFDQVEDLVFVRSFVSYHPRIKYVVGIMCRQLYTEAERTETAVPMDNTGYYWDSFNSAIQIDTTPEVPIYHKSKLVTGVEKMPYTWLFKPLKKLTIRLGGIFRSHGTQKNRAVFTSATDGIKIAPVICYESVFGYFVGDYIKLGANYIFVITNDGWWGDTPGYRQHNAISSLRAIETRRSIARSANTGISSFINQRGDVLQKLGWWERGAIRGSINANDKLTFYVKHGDYIGRSAFYLGIVLVFMLLLSSVLTIPGKR
jgi:apolipoprotein N-acyltransferase